MWKTLQFYRDCFSWALKPSWGLSEKASSLVGLLIPILIKAVPGWETRLTNLLWQIPLSVFATVLVVRLFRAPYELYRLRHQESEETERKLRARVSHCIRADWQQGVDGEEIWRVVGPEQQRKDYISLCELAGAMLRCSPNVFRTLIDEVRRNPDPVKSWMQFLKQREGLSTTQYAEWTAKGGQESGVILFGSIENLPDVSSRACIYCAACEI